MVINRDGVEPLGTLKKATGVPSIYTPDKNLILLNILGYCKNA